MRERDSDTDLPIYAIPAKIKKEGEPYIYKGTLSQYLDRFEFCYQNRATTLTFKIPLVDHKGGKTYMKFGAAYGQQCVVFFETHDWHLAMSGNY